LVCVATFGSDRRRQKGLIDQIISTPIFPSPIESIGLFREAFGATGYIVGNGNIVNGL